MKFSNIRAKLPSQTELQEACQLIESGKLWSVDVVQAVMVVEQLLQDGNEYSLIELEARLIEFETEYSVYKELQKDWN